MRTYTLTGGDAAKLLATAAAPGLDPAVTETVATIRDHELTRQVAELLNRIASNLDFAAAWYVSHDESGHRLAAAFGLRPDQLVEQAGGPTMDWHWSLLADATPADGSGRIDPWNVNGSIGALLAATDQMADPARRAVRRELTRLLAVYDGPPVIAEIWALDGIVTMSVADYLATRPADDVVALLDEQLAGLQAREQVADWYSHHQGHELYGLVDELLAAGAEVTVCVDSDDVRAWLAQRRPELLPAAS